MIQALRSRARAIVIGLVVVVAAYLLFFSPMRTYIDQRQQMNAAEDRYAMLVKTNEELTKRAEVLQSDAEVERIARENYELVRPGQQAFAVMPPPQAPAPPAAKKDDDGWLSKLTPW